MKYILILLSLLLISISKIYAINDPLVISNNAYVDFAGDSIWANDDQNGVGTRVATFWQSAQVSLHPNRIIFVYLGSHSGGTMDMRLTNDLPQSIGFMGYQSNNFQHIVFANATDNGALSSNQMFLATSNECLFPLYSSDGSGLPLTLQTGWMGNHTFQIINTGYIPENASDGVPATEGQRSGANYQAGKIFGFIAYDFWLDRVLIWTNDIVNNSGSNIQYAAGGHVLDGGAWDQMTDLWRNTTPSDTNVANSIIDFATATATYTNNCVISSISKNGNSISFVQLDNSLAPGYFVPHADGSITNDTRHAFILDPTNATFFNYKMAITGLSPGLYNVYIDGVLSAQISSSEFASGWNMFTNNVGPIWNQREEVLFRVLDWRYVDRKTLKPKTAGDGIGEVSIGSNLFTQWTIGNRGDALIASMNTKMTQIQTNYLPQYPQSMYAAAQTTNHTFRIEKIPTAIIKNSVQIKGAVKLR